MKFERAIKKLRSLLEEHSLSFLESGVSWSTVTGETTQSCYVHRDDAIYLNPKDIGWSWTYGKTTIAVMLHELGHRLAEKLLTRNILREKSMSTLFGYYHQNYIRKLRFASGARKRELFDVASRYALVHPADDVAEIFSVTIQYILKNKDPIEFVRDSLKSELCKNKIEKMLSLIEAARALNEAKK